MIKLNIINDKRGQESLMATLIFCVVFFSSFAFLASIIPYAFSITEEQRRKIDIPYEYEAPEIFSSHISEYDNDTLIYPMILELRIDLYDIDIWVYWNWASGKETIHVMHTWVEWIFWRRYDEAFPTCTKEYVLSNVENNVSQLHLACDHHSYYVSISFNQSKYDNLEEAWDDGELFFYLGMGYNETIASYASWSLITRILFFQMPNVHPLINYMIAIPLWIMILFIIVTIVSRFIPFIGGG